MDSVKGLFDSVKDAVVGAVSRGVSEVEKQAQSGRLLLEIRQEGSKRSALLERMGREAFFLRQAGELSQFSQFERPFQLIHELDVRIAQLEKQLTALGAETVSDSPVSPEATEDKSE